MSPRASRQSHIPGKSDSVTFIVGLVRLRLLLMLGMFLVLSRYLVNITYIEIELILEEIGPDL